MKIETKIKIIRSDIQNWIDKIPDGFIKTCYQEQIKLLNEILEDEKS